MSQWENTPTKYLFSFNPHATESATTRFLLWGDSSGIQVPVVTETVLTSGPHHLSTMSNHRQPHINSVSANPSLSQDSLEKTQPHSNSAVFNHRNTIIYIIKAVKTCTSNYAFYKSQEFLIPPSPSCLCTIGQSRAHLVTSFNSTESRSSCSSSIKNLCWSSEILVFHEMITLVNCLGKILELSKIYQRCTCS